MTSSSADLITTLLASLAGNDEASALSALSKVSEDDVVFATMLRTCIFHASNTPFFYRKLFNAWSAKGQPGLKGSSRQINIELISDCTVDGLALYLQLFCASYGLQAIISISPYDSVEQTALTGGPAIPPDVSLLLLSEYWLRKHVGNSLVRNEDARNAKAALSQIINGLLNNRSGHVVVGNFSPPAWPLPAAAVAVGGVAGQSAAIAKINSVLGEFANERCHVLDVALATHMAGGGNVSARLAHLRAHAFLEERGLVQVAREAASGIAHLFGRSHRALLTDWDNTLWGGEVGELGFHQVVCGQDNADALSYYLLQTYIASLTNLGVLLAAISRNDPAMAGILDGNTDLVLRREHYAALALSWGDKSDSVNAIETELNFSTDLMLYVDDNLVDLAQVMVRYPYIDTVIAGPSADQTLGRFSLTRYFNAFRVTSEDSNRTAMANVLADQKRQMSEATSPNEFLRSLNIQISVSSLRESNLDRVLALLQKTNQFNLTTKRHVQADLQRLIGDGAEIGVFSYNDKFGPQGIVGLIILIPSENGVEIDTWLMSCRVLNRKVENAMFAWASLKARGQTISGNYYFTPKNKLVSNLLDTLGFDLLSTENGSRAYKFSATNVAPIPDTLELKHE